MLNTDHCSRRITFYNTNQRRCQQYNVHRYLHSFSMSLMIRIHFDILWTVVADTLYQRFSQDLPRFEKNRANSTFRKFVDMPGKIEFDGNKFILRIRKRATTPILLGVEKLKKGIAIPWLDNKKMFIEWTA